MNVKLLSKKAATVLAAVSLMVSVMASSVSAAPAKKMEQATFEFSNVYQYDINTYDKEVNYKSLNVSIIDDVTLHLVLDTGTEKYDISNLSYKATENETYKTTLITASGNVSDNTALDLRLAFEKKDDANGNIIITEKQQITNQDGSTKTVTKEKFVRFADNEYLSLKQLVAGIKAGKEKNGGKAPAPASSAPVAPTALAAPTALVGPTPMTNDLPVVKSYKYSNYMYGGVFWNSNNLIQCNCNNLELKLSPLYGNLYYYTDPASGLQGTIIYNQSLVVSTSAQYSSVQSASGTNAIAFTYPIVDSESSPRFIPIKVGFKGLSVTFNIPYGADNNKTNGQNAMWQLNRQWTDFTNSAGDIMDDYHLEGLTSVSGVGKTVMIDTSVQVRLGVMYYFGSIPAQDVIFSDNFSIPRITTTVS
jgi:hypothetical protein